MNKIYAAAAILLAATLTTANARAEIVVGPGFGTACAEGGCPLYSGSVNAIGASSLDLYQSSTGPVGLSALMLILAVPNNPANSLTANPVTDAQLHVPATNSASTPVTVGGLSGETLMTHGDVYGNLNLIEPSIIGFNQLQSADYALFPTTYSAATNPISNFSLYQIPLRTSTAFAGGDLINIDFTSLPTGTFALGYGTPSLTVTGTSFAEAGVSGISAVPIPEPGALALLLGFAALGLAAAKRSR
jgi:hypothetical protein